MSSEPAPETIIREFMLHAIEQGDAADNDTTWEASVVAALDALVRERDQARAENERLRKALQQIAGFVTVTVKGLEVGVSETTKIARAALAAAQEIHPDDLDWEHAEVREGVTMGEQEPPAERCNEEIWAMGEFAAACSFPKGHDGKHSWHASRPEPPAECRHTNWRVEFRSPARGQVRPDPITYGQWVVCIDCGHERRGSVPPAKGGDR